MAAAEPAAAFAPAGSVESPAPTIQPRPRIQVLLATHNGSRWIEQQLDSLLAQTGVAIEVLVSDDGSTDGTRALLRQRAASDRRIVLLEHDLRFGSAAANFYYLLSQADYRRFEFFAFADQDDIWIPGKLQRQVRLLHGTGASGVSSDVLAFWPNGRTRPIRKSQPQRRWDHLLEPPGPGCTFLMTRDLAADAARWLQALDANGIEPLPKHDWLIYLIARCSGRTWYIDSMTSVHYRQHAHNEVGANVDLRARLKRLSILLRGDYQKMVRQAIEIARLVAESHHQPLPPERLRTMSLLRQGRRRRHEALLLALLSIGRL